jgi:hypothetical protein
MKPTPKTWIRTIAVFEMVGGTVGILFMLYVGLTTSFAWSALFVLPVVLLIFSFSFIAGLYLWRGTEFGRKSSIVVQLIQLPKLMSPFLVFSFSFGFDLFPHLSIMSGFSNVGIQFRVLADGQLFINSSVDGILLGSVFPQF